MAYRILVTGSRNWSNWSLVQGNLRKAWFDLGAGAEVTLVSGNARGLDTMAEAIWEASYLPVERHPATWRVNGRLDKSAGVRRNQAMVDLGADICLAFVMPCDDTRCRKPKPHDSHGTADCIRRAEAAGIPVTRIVVPT